MVSPAGAGIDLQAQLFLKHFLLSADAYCSMLQFPQGNRSRVVRLR